MIGITKRQKEVLNFIRVFIKENRFSPTMQEIADHFNFHVNAAQYHTVALDKKGYIIKGRKARTI